MLGILPSKGDEQALTQPGGVKNLPETHSGMAKDTSEVLRLENPIRSGKGLKGGFDKGP